MSNSANPDPWPELPALADWQKTVDTVHMWMQMVGKIRLELGPWINHSWGNALYVSTRGLTSSPIPCWNTPAIGLASRRWLE